MGGVGEVASRSERVLCFTIDPFYGGGIGALRPFLEWYFVDRGVAASFVYLAATQALSPAKLLLGRWRLVHRTSGGAVRDMGVGSFPYLEALSTWLPRRFLAEQARRHTHRLGVLGYATSAAFLAADGAPFALWLASTYDAERAAQHGGWSRWHERLIQAANRWLVPECRAMERRVVGAAERVMAMSSATLAELRALGAAAERAEVVPPPVDVGRFTPPPGDSLAGRERFVLALARWDDPRKRPGLLLDAFAQLRRGRPDLRLVMAGRHGPGLAAEVVARGLGECVDVPGEVDEATKVSLYRRAALFVLPSRQEGFGIVLAEAMACGTPVVATRSGGPGDLIEDGESGWLVDHDDAALARALAAALAAPDSWRRVATRGRARVETTCSYAAAAAALDRALGLRARGSG